MPQPYIAIKVSLLEKEVEELRERVFLLEQALQAGSRSGPTEFHERVERDEAPGWLGQRALI